MIGFRFRERQRLANKARHALPERVVPALLMRRLPGFFANGMMRAFGQDRLIGLPEVGVGTTPAIGGGDGVPQAPTGVCTAIPNDKGNDLPGTATQRRPQPLLVLPRIYKRP